MVELNHLIRDIGLLIKTPREFVYSFTYPADQQVEIAPYDPAVKKIGERLVTQMHDACPGLKIHFLGSAVLGIAGQRDIDLLAAADPSQFHRYIAGISSVLGPPSKRRRTFMEWQTNREGCAVELLLADPESPLLTGPLKTFRKIKSDPSLIGRYEKLKLSSNGVSIREYKRRRLAFFNMIDAI